MRDDGDLGGGHQKGVLSRPQQKTEKEEEEGICTHSGGGVRGTYKKTRTRQRHLVVKFDSANFTPGFLLK